MKSYCLFAVFALLLLLSPLNEAYCQDDIEYWIQINNDNSASWKIIQFTDVNATIDDWESYQQKIFTLIETAANVTKRQMAIDPLTIDMETVIAWDTETKTTEFRFKWLNFSTSESGNLVLGDVFRVQSFFAGLYGDGELQVTYPIGYSVLESSPTPDSQDLDLRMLKWFSTQAFLNGNPTTELTRDFSSSSANGWVQYALLGLVLAAVALGGFYTLRWRRSKIEATTMLPAEGSLLESDEEKVIKLLRSSGGSMHQSDIGEHFSFSKAKTSQLLSSLERKGAVARYKRGRDKIVTLIEPTAGDES